MIEQVADHIFNNFSQRLGLSTEIEKKQKTKKTMKINFKR